MIGRKVSQCPDEASAKSIRADLAFFLSWPRGVVFLQQRRRGRAEQHFKSYHLGAFRTLPLPVEGKDAHMCSPSFFIELIERTKISPIDRRISSLVPADAFRYILNRSQGKERVRRRRVSQLEQQPLIPGSQSTSTIEKASLLRTLS